MGQHTKLNYCEYLRISIREVEMNTKFWGPPGWKFLHAIAFNYPEKINMADPEDRERMFYYKQLFENLQFTLPCKYCRLSYQKFLKELPIDAFLRSRKDITYWLYLIHNKVNKKLRDQEQELFDKKVRELRESNLNPLEYFQKLRTLRDQILFTKEDPPYHEMCGFYESQRASCNKDKNKIASCRL